MFAKDKDQEQVAKINDSMMNRIVKEIKENRNMFKPIKGLSPLDYKMLLPKNFEYYCNDELNKCFNKWNKKYGNNIKFDEDNQDKNNISAVANEIKEELLSIEPDDSKVLTSLVISLYANPTNRKKKLLWYMFGQQMYENLYNNTTDNDYCWGCGKRSDKLNAEHMCLNCRGLKEINCIDCYRPVIINAKDRKTCRCSDCQTQKDRVDHSNRQRKYMNKIKNDGYKN